MKIHATIQEEAVSDDFVTTPAFIAILSDHETGTENGTAPENDAPAGVEHDGDAAGDGRPMYSQPVTADDQQEVRLLLRGIANGDRLCFAEFHRRFSGMVYATAIQVLHNHEDAQDTSQEVFSSLWKKARMFMDDRGKPSTWLAAMARNRSIDRLRARQRRTRLNDSFGDESRTGDALVRVDPAREASTNEMGRHVRSAVMELSPEQREAIQLAFFEGLTQLEIAHKTGEPLGTIKARIRRGLGRLRNIVKE